MRVSLMKVTDQLVRKESNLMTEEAVLGRFYAEIGTNAVRLTAHFIGA
jgi:hypothetical protein